MSMQQVYGAEHVYLEGVQPPSGLGAVGPVVHIAPGCEIYAEGDDADLFYKVVSGVVRICKFLSDGRRQIESFHAEGEILGLEAADAHRFTAEAVSDCTLIAYRRRNLASRAAADESVARELFAHAMDSLARAQDHLLVLGRRSAMEKLASFLAEWADAAPDHRRFTLAMTRQDIADYLGLTIETVSRTFTQLEKDAVISIPTPREIRLTDPAALRRLNA